MKSTNDEVNNNVICDAIISLLHTFATLTFYQIFERYLIRRYIVKIR